MRTKAFSRTLLFSSNLSLRTKIAFTTAAVLAFNLIIALVVIEILHNKILDRLLEFERTLLANTVSRSLEGIMKSGKPADCGEILQSLVDEHYLVAARLFIPDGTILCSSNSAEVGGKVHEAELRSLISGKPQTVQGESHEGILTHLAVPLLNGPVCSKCHSLGFQKINDSDTGIIAPSWLTEVGSKQLEVNGVLGLEMGLYTTVSLLRIDKQVMILSGLVMLCLVTLLLSFLLSLMVTSRIGTLSDQVRSAGLGNLGIKVSEEPADEIGWLGKSFNRLLIELHKTHLALQESHQKEMSQMDRLASLGEMAASVAHEIKNPLAGICSAVQLLTRHELDSEFRDKVQNEVTHSVERLDAVVRNLLAFARTEELHFSQGDVNELARKVSGFCATMMRTDSLRVSLELAEDLPLVKFDAKSLHQVLLNLLINAQQAGATTAMIRTELWPKQHLSEYLKKSHVDQLLMEMTQAVTIQVQNNGPSIPEAHLDKIFKPFFTTKQEGTGLGLAICKRIIRGHGGEIFVENRPEGGASFLVVLPVASAT